MLNELGIRIGHWTDEIAKTGCTVVVFDSPATASAEVRGGAPATRELALLSPERSVSRIDAALLTGGSAFGLAAADGVMRWCAEQGRGVPTPAAAVPIVPSLALYDLAVGDPSVRPDAEAGYAACDVADARTLAGGRVGAGTGAALGMVRGPLSARPGGLGISAARAGELVVVAVVAVNAFGVVDEGGELDAMVALARPEGVGAPALFGNTVIGVVVSNARIDKLGCLLLAQGAHDGLARAIVPAHSRVDGDAFVAAATGKVEADVDAVRLLGVAATERAIRAAARE